MTSPQAPHGFYVPMRWQDFQRPSFWARPFISATMTTAVTGLGRVLESRYTNPDEFLQKVLRIANNMPYDADKAAYAAWVQHKHDHPREDDYNANFIARKVHTAVDGFSRQRYSGDVKRIGATGSPAEQAQRVRDSTARAAYTESKNIETKFFTYLQDVAAAKARRSGVISSGSAYAWNPQPTTVPQTHQDAIQMAYLIAQGRSSGASNNVSVNGAAINLDEMKRAHLPPPMRRLSPAVQAAMDQKLLASGTSNAERDYMHNMHGPPMGGVTITPPSGRSEIPLIFTLSVLASGTAAGFSLLLPDPTGTDADIPYGFFRPAASAGLYALVSKAFGIDQSTLFAFLVQFGGVMATDAIYSASGPNW